MSETSQSSGCPCGRSHPTQARVRQRPARASADALASKHYEGLLKGYRTRSGQPALDYAGNCEKPLELSIDTDRNELRPYMAVRCRKCPPCLRARMGYWALAAVNETRLAALKGGRTWFGTLTLSPSSQDDLRQRALEAWAIAHADSSEAPEWFDDPQCDHRFKLLRDQLQIDLAKYWKRLRAKGHSFRYFVVTERHRSGLPHLHWLLHEQGPPITKRALEAEWPYGHTKVVLVGGRSRNTAGPEKAAWYVAKYLSKDYQSRQIASRLYRPERSAYGVQ